MRHKPFAIAADRDLGVRVLNFLLEGGYRPCALLLTEDSVATRNCEVLELCSFLDPEHVIVGKEIRSPEKQAMLRTLDLELIQIIRFPYIVPEEVLSIPRLGVLNLHPAFLPYNRGWHTPTWSIMDSTPYGATLHFLDAGVDTGDIVHQKRLEVSPGDTANTVYQRIAELEFEVFQEAWPWLMGDQVPRRPQDRDAGTFHRRADLFTEEVQKLDLEASMPVGEVLRKLRALTTNRVDEAAYYEVNGSRYRVQLTITEEPRFTDC